jgi:hypothetical protein
MHQGVEGDQKNANFSVFAFLVALWWWRKMEVEVE